MPAETKEKVIKPVATLTFPELLGKLITEVVPDTKRMPEAKSQLNIWYNATDPETRQETAKQVRKFLEDGRSVVEACYQHFRELAYRDLQ